MKMKYNEKKFSGDIGECWHQFVDEYQKISWDYKFSQFQKRQYIHNIVRKDEKRFYLDQVQNFATKFQQAVEMIKQEQNAPVRQASVNNYLFGIRVADFVADGWETSVSISHVYRTIQKLSRQGSASHW